MSVVRDLIRGVERAAAGARPSLDLSDGNLNNFLALYAAFEPPPCPQERTLKAWRERFRSGLPAIELTVENGRLAIPAKAAQRLLLQVHAGDGQFSMSDLHRRIEALQHAIPHLLAQ